MSIKITIAIIVIKKTKNSLEKFLLFSFLIAGKYFLFPFVLSTFGFMVSLFCLTRINSLFSSSLIVVSGVAASCFFSIFSDGLKNHV